MDYPEYSLLLRSPQKGRSLFEPAYDDESDFQELPDPSLSPPREFGSNAKFEDLTNDLMTYLENEECFIKQPPIVSPNVMIVQKSQVGYKFLESLSSYAEDLVEPPLANVGKPVTDQDIDYTNFREVNPFVLGNSFIMLPKMNSSIAADSGHPNSPATMPLPTKEPSLSGALPNEEYGRDYGEYSNLGIIDLNKTVQRNQGTNRSPKTKHILKISNIPESASTNNQRSSGNSRKPKKAVEGELYIPPPPNGQVPIPMEKVEKLPPTYERSRIMTRSHTKNNQDEFKHESIGVTSRKNNPFTKKARRTQRKKAIVREDTLIDITNNNDNNNNKNNNIRRPKKKKKEKKNNKKKRLAKPTKKKKLLILKDRNFQKRKLRKDALICKTKGRTDQKGKIGRGYHVELKPCRRINTGFAGNGLFPYYVCSAPYKYILRISAPAETHDEQDYDFTLRTFRQPKRLSDSEEEYYFGGGKEYNTTSEEEVDEDEDDDEDDHSDDGIDVMLKKVSFDNDGQIQQLYHLQFTMTSFLNQSVEFRLVVNDEQGNDVFRSAKFKIVARKVKFEDDRFWNQFLVDDTTPQVLPPKKKKKKNKKNQNLVTGKKRKRMVYEQHHHQEYFDSHDIEEESARRRKKKKY